MRKIFLVFMQTAPKTFSLQQFSDELKAFENIQSAHNIQTWSIDGESHVLSAHVVVKSGTLRDEIVEIKHRIHELLHEHQFEHVTLDVEVEGENCAYVQHAHEN